MMKDKEHIMLFTCY